MERYELMTMQALVGEVLYRREQDAEDKRQIADLAAERNRADKAEQRAKVAECDLRVERDRHELTKVERDSARRKLGAICRTVNALEGWERARQPRVFLRELTKAVKACIARNDIHLTEGGMAQ